MGFVAILLALQQDAHGREVTLHLEQVPLREAARQALERFDFATDWVRGPEGARLVDLRLDRAGFWEALDAVSIRSGRGPASFPRHPAVAGPNVHFCGTGEGRTFRGHATEHGMRVSVEVVFPDCERIRPTSELQLRISALFPPGRRHSEARIENFLVNRRATRAPDFTGWDGSEGRIVPINFQSWIPASTVGTSLMLEGVFVLRSTPGGAGERWPFSVGNIPIAASDEEESSSQATRSTPLWFWIATTAALLLPAILVMLRCRRS